MSCFKCFTENSNMEEEYKKQEKIKSDAERNRLRRANMAEDERNEERRKAPERAAKCSTAR